MTLLLPAWTNRQPLMDTIHCIDAMTLLKTLPDRSINCVVTSPPYFGLRDYKIKGQVGLEKTPQDYVDTLVALFRQVRRVLRDDGVVFLNLGDSYAGSWGNYAPNGIKGQQRSKTKKGERWERSGYPDTQLLPPTATGTGLPPKNLIGIPWRVAFALQADGWILRSAAPWIKASAMPESVQDRPTTAHEYVFQFSKSEVYWFDREAILKPFADERNGNPGTYTRTTQADKGSSQIRQDLGFVAKDGTWTRGEEVGGRNRRTTDTFLDAMDAQIAHWKYIRENGGVIVGDDNTIEAFLVNTKPLSIAHFATFPLDLVEPCVRAGCPCKGIVLDPFMGSGTTALVARASGRHYIGSELNPDYVAIAKERLRQPLEQHHVIKETVLDDLPLFMVQA